MKREDESKINAKLQARAKFQAQAKNRTNSNFWIISLITLSLILLFVIYSGKEMIIGQSIYMAGEESYNFQAPLLLLGIFILIIIISILGYEIYWQKHLVKVN